LANIINGTSTGSGGLITTGDSSDELQIQTAETTAITVDSGQRTKFPTTIGVGGATPSTSGSGISFPATQSASTDANTLDDYEEGTWTPIDSSGASLSFTGASGTYVKIGSLCYITGALTFPATASGADVIIGGLPFNPSGATQYNNYGPPIRNNKSLSMQVFGVNNTTFILLPIGNYTTYVANSAMTSGAMLFSFTYRTA
jgi:hypothetical protein